MTASHPPPRISHQVSANILVGQLCHLGTNAFDLLLDEDKLMDVPVRCSVVQCGAVRCGAVQCGAVQCGAVRGAHAGVGAGARAGAGTHAGAVAYCAVRVPDRKTL
jgi:hypothetical protein